MKFLRTSDGIPLNIDHISLISSTIECDRAFIYAELLNNKLVCLCSFPIDDEIAPDIDHVINEICGTAAFLIAQIADEKCNCIKWEELLQDTKQKIESKQIK